MNVKTNPIEREERDGYYVQPMMKRIWAVQLDMLNQIDALCRYHHINYYGWFGTLLGAVRHQGFIPWDDDLDLAMLREDYERFRYHMRAELPEGWQISEHEPGAISVFNTDTVRLDSRFLDRSHGCPFKTGIDIFCLDCIPKDETEARLHLNLFWAAHSLCLNWGLSEEDERWMGDSKWDYLRELEELSGHHFDRQHSIKEQLYFIGDRIAAMYWDAGCDVVTNMIWLYEHPYYHIPTACFDKVIEVPFENTVIPILEDHDLICRLTYGEDYMTPMIEHKHDYLKDQVEKLRKYFEDKGSALPQEFDLELE